MSMFNVRTENGTGFSTSRFLSFFSAATEQVSRDAKTQAEIPYKQTQKNPSNGRSKLEIDAQVDKQRECAGLELPKYLSSLLSLLTDPHSIAQKGRFPLAQHENPSHHHPNYPFSLPPPKRKRKRSPSPIIH